MVPVGSGETNGRAPARLGPRRLGARIDTVDENSLKRFYLQYRFPPCSTGSVSALYDFL
jgi:polyribonucleotide nucleotidyltransferase